MFIIQNGEMIEVPDTFLESHYNFGMGRIRRIVKKSGLSFRVFASVYDIHYPALVSWVTKRTKGHINKPCPPARVKLAFIEASLTKRT